MNNIISSANLSDSALEGILLKETYLIEKKIGQGGMAWVYRGSHQKLGGKVAIKILASLFANNTTILERFLREAKIQYSLQHPNIIRVLDFIEECAIYGFVMEWCDGGDLDGLAKECGGTISLHQLQAIFPPILDALAYAHAHGIVHRDLKPQNILLFRQNNKILPKVSDFGIAKDIYNSLGTQAGSMMGTAHFMSPEQIEDSKCIDHRADIYSLGVMLYALTTGRMPYQGDTIAYLTRILSDAPIPAADEAPELLQPVIMRCLEKNPADRFSCCMDLSEALSQAIQSTLAKSQYSSSTKNALVQANDERSLSVTPPPNHCYLSKSPVIPKLTAEMATADSFSACHTPLSSQTDILQETRIADTLDSVANNNGGMEKAPSASLFNPSSELRITHPNIFLQKISTSENGFWYETKIQQSITAKAFIIGSIFLVILGVGGIWLRPLLFSEPQTIESSRIMQKKNKIHVGNNQVKSSPQTASSLSDAKNTTSLPTLPIAHGDSRSHDAGPPAGDPVVSIAPSVEPNIPNCKTMQPSKINSLKKPTSKKSVTLPKVSFDKTNPSQKMAHSHLTKNKLRSAKPYIPWPISFKRLKGKPYVLLTVSKLQTDEHRITIMTYNIPGIRHIFYRLHTQLAYHKMRFFQTWYGMSEVDALTCGKQPIWLKFQLNDGSKIGPYRGLLRVPCSVP